MSTHETLYVEGLSIRNFKGIRQLDIVPRDYVITFAGENGSGKSSGLDALWAALQWAAASKDIPDVIANGEDEACVRVDLGEYVLTRVWERVNGAVKTSIEVRDKKGEKLKGAKKILSAIVGKISLDPTAFGRLRDTEQREELIRFISDQLPFDIDEMAKERSELFDRRKTAGQDARRLEGHYAELPEPPPGTPGSEVSVAELSAAHALAVKKRQRARHLREAVDRAKQCATNAMTSLLDAKAEQDKCESLLKEAVDAAKKIPSKEEMGDPTEIQGRIADAEEINANVRAAEARRLACSAAGSARSHYKALDDEIYALDAKKIAALAKVKMPVDGLSFDDSRVTYDAGEGSGPVPLRQASQAQRILAGIYLSLSGDHRLRAVRVTDAALLSKSTMAMLREKARAGEFQLLNERADDRGAECYVIESGELLRQCSGCSMVEGEEPSGKIQEGCSHNFEWDRLAVEA